MFTLAGRVWFDVFSFLGALNSCFPHHVHPAESKHVYHANEITFAIMNSCYFFPTAKALDVEQYKAKQLGTECKFEVKLHFIHLESQKFCKLPRDFKLL